jgi:hypothetical protein
LEDDYQRMADLIFTELEVPEEVSAAVQKIQDKVDAAFNTAQEVADVTPEPVAEKPKPEPQVKASKELDSAVETISSLQMGEILEHFNSIEDDDERRTAKNEFKAAFGNPAQLPVTRFEEALKWAIKKTQPEAEEVVSAPATVEEEVAPAATAEEDLAPEPEPAHEAVPCTFKGCKVKDIDDEDVIELSRMQNNNNALCAKHLRETKRK